MRAFGSHSLFVSTIQLVFVASVFGDVVSLPAIRDGFVREQAPTLNFGGAGNLCVAGAESVNANAEPRGRFDSLIQFDAATAVDTLNTTYGPGGWSLTSIELRLSELGAPQNPIFPRGVGSAHCAWLPNATFTEGAGTPNAPVVGAGDDLTWNYLQSLLGGATEHLLSDISNFGSDGPRVCAIPSNSAFAQALRTGQTVTLHITPATSSLGFTFISRNFFNAQLRPRLDMTVEPIVVGDVNCDNQLNAQDVPMFVLALVNPSAFTGCDINRADVDANGLIDGRDIARFVDQLMTP